MTVYRGLLLFDFPETAIKCPAGKWENQLGYRGMMEVWKLVDTDIVLRIDVNEDYLDDEDSWEIVLENDNGDMAFPFFGTFAECDKKAKEIMASFKKNSFRTYL